MMAEPVRRLHAVGWHTVPSDVRDLARWMTAKGRIDTAADCMDVLDHPWLYAQDYIQMLREQTGDVAA